jgi:hypothetical protein
MSKYHEISMKRKSDQQLVEGEWKVAQWQDLEGSEKAANCTDENRTSIAATYNRTGVVMLKKTGHKMLQAFWSAHRGRIFYPLVI